MQKRHCRNAHRAYRLPFDDRAHGPAVVLATLPGEAHAIGLQMAALVIAMSGCRVCYVGPDRIRDSCWDARTSRGVSSLQAL